MKSRALALLWHFIYTVLIVQVSLLNSLAFAKTNAPTPAEKQRLLANALLDFAAHQSMMDKTPRQFERDFLYGFKPADREEIFAKIRNLKHIPSMLHVGSKLVMDDGLHKVELEWPDPAKMEFKINGASFSYDASKNLVGQLEAMEKREKARRHASIIEGLLPSADAEPITISMIILLIVSGSIGAIIGGLVSGPANDIGAAVWCNTIGGWMATKSCIEYERTKRSERRKKSPKFDAVENQSGTDKKNILGKFEGQDWECPAENDGKERQYRGRLRMVELKDGKRIPTGDGTWIEVVGKMDSKGVPKDFIFTVGGSGDPTKIDLTSPEGAKKLIVHVAFDPTDKSVGSYRVPNPDFYKKSVGLVAPTKTLDRDQVSTSEESEQMDLADDMVRFLNYRNYKCVEEKVTADTLAGVDSGSPAEPKKDPTTTK